jgi:predicted Zn-dependent protease with MMP-like domain/Tfp pilus assembly protein PilF
VSQEPPDDEDEGDAPAPGTPGTPGMDEGSAHLDRGWDLLGQGDFDGARASAKALLALDPEAPEAYTLLGAVAAAAGDPEQALNDLGKAIELDPDYFDPQLYAAETLLDAGGDLEDALAHCEAAMDLAEEEEEILDALLLKAEIEIALGDRDDEARETLAELPPIELPAARYHVRAGRLFLDLDEFDAAEEQFKIALKQEPDLAEAHHGIGLVAECRDQAAERTAAWLKVRELDLKEPAPPWGVSEEQFEEVAEAALAELPEPLRKRLDNVPVVVADYPSEELIADGVDPRLLGLFSGVPLGEQSNVGGAPHLDCIYLYQKNIERIARSKAEVADEIRKTLLHETAHFFGLDEDELEAIGLD